MSDSADWLSSNSGGSGYPGVGFPTIGATVKGTIEGTPRAVETEFGDRLAIDLIALDGCTAVAGENGDPISEGDGVTVWLKPGAMAAAVKSAIGEAGATGLQEGGVLAVQYERDGEKKKASWNAPKLYRASYKAPAPSVPVGGDLI
jgi:hypothetical protein